MSCPVKAIIFYDIITSIFQDVLQVREKLSAGEYKEFVGFMKALKTKTMNISQVLQSIVGIFSGPDRLRLRTGYIPLSSCSFSAGLFGCHIFLTPTLVMRYL